jgi:hypothetical protein
MWSFSALVLPIFKQNIQGMTSVLTTNSLTRIRNGEIICSPVIQIMDFKLTLEDCSSIVLFDGGSTLGSLFSSTLGQYFSSSQIEKGSLVELQDFTCRSIQDNKYVFTLPSSHGSSFVIIYTTIILIFPLHIPSIFTCIAHTNHILHYLLCGQCCKC